MTFYLLSMLNLVSVENSALTHGSIESCFMLFMQWIVAVGKSPPAKHARLDKSPASPSSSKESSPKSDKGKAPKGKTQGKERLSKSLEKVDPSLYPYERRAARVVAEEGIKYTSDGVGCPFPGCDSKGTADFWYVLIQCINPKCPSNLSRWGKFLLNIHLGYEVNYLKCAYTIATILLQWSFTTGWK